nr:MAG: tail-collar fiber protein [Bacteriophage sp.]
MANLSNYMLTDTGRALLAKVNSGACTLKITKAKMGEAETSLNELITKTDLVGSSLRLIDISSSKAEENICNVVAIVTNEGLEQNFYVRQIGVFAEGIAATNPGTGVNPETVQETLLLVAYDSLPDILPAENTGVSITKEFNIGIIVSNAENVQVAISPAGVVTTRVLDNHDQNQNAHSNLIKKIFNASDATLESVKSSVKTWCKETISEIFGIASATTDNIKSKIKSWAQEQINSWLETLDIRYNIAQNGYICLGKLFGNAIIQWGNWHCGEEGTYPISYKQSGINTIGLHVGKLGNINVILDSDRIGSKTNFLFTGSNEGNYAVYYWSIGK